MINKNSNNNNIKSVYNWWNSEYTKKWHNLKYDKKHIEYPHVVARLNKAIEYLINLKPDKNSKILEFGFGGGQSSKKILDLGYDYTGVEISKHMIQSAEEKCADFIKKNKARFYHGSLDEKNPKLMNGNYDVILICGALQYTNDVNFALREINKLLNKDGYFIICQANMYAIHEFFGFRKFLKTAIRFLTNENYFYSYSNSYKSLLLETKLQKYFKKYENSNFFKSKFMTRYENEWSFKIKKRLFSLSTLKKHLKFNGFNPISDFGAPFLLFHKNRIINNLYIIIDSILNFMHKFLKFKFLINIADNVIIVSKKNV
jgi:SAM-dependent methyltransferase